MGYNRQKCNRTQAQTNTCRHLGGWNSTTEVRGFEWEMLLCLNVLLLEWCSHVGYISTDQWSSQMLISESCIVNELPMVSTAKPESVLAAIPKEDHSLDDIPVKYLSRQKG